MINSVKISGYRALESFQMADLGRVNLLVGKNNSGKTSILEALYILASGSDPVAIWNVLTRRGEQAMQDPSPNRVFQSEVDIAHLFHGHDVRPGAEFTFSTTNQKPGKHVRYWIEETKPEESPQLFAQLNDEGIAGPRLALKTQGHPNVPMMPIPLSRQGSIRFDAIQHYINLRLPKSEQGSAQFITTDSLNVSQIFQLWSSIVLTQDEDRIIDALRILEPKIDRIAQVNPGIIQIPGQGIGFANRGGFFVRLSQNEKRIPIGSFGDGIWRMLAISVALVRAKDSILLIDEIDTGLHHSVMSDMWKLVFQTAEKLNVQVFATTHSYDCVYSLASICHEGSKNDVSIQRVERESATAISFSGEEIMMAAKENIELR